MAARTRKIFHDEDTRKRIRAAAIIDRLQAFALGNDPEAMSKGQVAAAKLLLDKVLPDLRSAEVTAEETKTYVFRVPPEAKDHEEWMRLYGPKTIEAAPASISSPERSRRLS